ncbi:MAG TPA: hypothetical protein VLG40_01350 [Candidatus Saccharimonas sp.]|nr:hypothetical protein [Candidatus Saccharimonas sp.]
MYKLIATTRNDYLNEPKTTGRDLKAIDAFIQKAAPTLQPWFYNVGPKEAGMTFKMISYGKFTYSPTKDPHTTVTWPVIGMALQKNYISMYVSVTKNGKPLVDFYADRLGYTRRGNNNFSFKTFEQLDKAALEQMIKEGAQIFADDPLNPVRFKEATA